jgi:hypothetical protein
VAEALGRLSCIYIFFDLLIKKKFFLLCSSGYVEFSSSVAEVLGIWCQDMMLVLL